MSNLKTCKKHIEKPALIYHKCAACEIEMYREERNKYKKALEGLLPLCVKGEEAHTIIQEALQSYNRIQQKGGSKDE